MRRILYVLVATISALVLLFSYHTSTQPRAVAQPGVVAQAGSAAQAQPAATTSGGGNGSGSGGSGAGGRRNTGSTGTATTSSSVAAGQTYDGTAYDTPWGPVQVRITVADGKITAAEATSYPNNDHHSSRINSEAVPMLNIQAVSAQSAELDGVGGATYTTQAYEQSLQSAIDAAGL